MTPSTPRIPVSRRLVGAIALACLAGAVVVGVVESFENVWCAALLRSGLFTGALWLALPSLERSGRGATVSVLALFVILGLMMLVARRPQLLRALIPLAVLVGIAFLVIRPRRRD